MSMVMTGIPEHIRSYNGPGECLGPIQLKNRIVILSKAKMT
jgi:hypothetical protein